MKLGLPHVAIAALGTTVLPLAALLVSSARLVIARPALGILCVLRSQHS